MALLEELEAVFRSSELLPVGCVLQTRYLDEVEVDVSHELGRGRVGGLEAVEQHVVARAVGLAVEGVVGQVVAAGEGAHLKMR